jgi:RNA polymerase sigma-32 factor
MLDPGEEHLLARKFRDDGDEDAARRLVRSHMRLVVRVAMQYRRYSVSVEDLISEGTLGLIKAVERFDPDRGFRLSTYALWWIRAAMTDYVIRSWSLVRMGQTTEQRKLFFNLRKMKSKLRAYDEGDLRDHHVRQIVRELKVPEKEVVSMNRRLAAQDASLNVPAGDLGEGEWQDWLRDDGETQDERLAIREEYTYRRHMLDEVMKGLKDRERQIVMERHLVETPKTLEALSRQHRISRERVRQIEHEAVAKIKRWMEREETSVTH